MDFYTASLQMEREKTQAFFSLQGYGIEVKLKLRKGTSAPGGKSKEYPYKKRGVVVE